MDRIFQTLVTPGIRAATTPPNVPRSAAAPRPDARTGLRRNAVAGGRVVNVGPRAPVALVRRRPEAASCSQPLRISHQNRRSNTPRWLWDLMAPYPSTPDPPRGAHNTPDKVLRHQ